MTILNELTYSALDAVKVGDYFAYPKEGKYKVGLKVTPSYMIPMPTGPFETVQEAVAAAEVFEKRVEFPTNPGKPLEMPKTVVTCVYCGQEYPDGTPTAKAQILTDHIKVCEKHPMRAAEQRIKQLEQALSGLVDHYYVPSEAWDYAKKALTSIIREKNDQLLETIKLLAPERIPQTVADIDAKINDMHVEIDKLNMQREELLGGEHE